MLAKSATGAEAEEGRANLAFNKPSGLRTLPYMLQSPDITPPLSCPQCKAVAGYQTSTKASFTSSTVIMKMECRECHHAWEAKLVRLHPGRIFRI